MADRITRATHFGELQEASVRLYNELERIGCETIGELLDLGPQLHHLLGRKSIRELATLLPPRWRERVLTPPKRPRKADIVGRPVRRRAWCPRCERSISREESRASLPCPKCGSAVEQRGKGRPRKTNAS